MQSYETIAKEHGKKTKMGMESFDFYGQPPPLKDILIKKLFRG